MNQRLSSLRQLGTKNNTKINGYLPIVLFLVIFSSYSIAHANSQNSSATNLPDSISTDLLPANAEGEKTYVETQNNSPAINTSSENYVSISGESVVIDADSTSSANQQKTSSNISIDISSKKQSTPDTPVQENSSAPNLVINGQEIDIPENGRLRETVKNGDTTTKLRTNIDNNGSSSISIRTDSN